MVKVISSETTQSLFSMPGCLRDAAPDAWGRRVIINKKLGSSSRNADTAQLDELTYLLESGSDRIGALDFQLSPTEYKPRSPVSATLTELQESAGRVERGEPLSPELDQALNHASSDFYSVVKAEYIAMRLAEFAGLNVAPVSLAQALGKDVLLIERFDRVLTPDGWLRKPMVSALTLFGLDEMMARYASYEKLAKIIRYKFKEPSATLRELFSRLVFNIICGNTDDHGRNHAAFWDGQGLTLTPAYDICPQARSGNEASQGMLISGSNRMSLISVCLDTAHNFQLSRDEALEIVVQQKRVIEEKWDAVCGEAELDET